MPGGESTTMSNLLTSSGLFDEIKAGLTDGLPVLGTCAGMILLAVRGARRAHRPAQFGTLDLTVRRNGYGRQLDSFETDLAIAGDDVPFHGVFIRAPRVVAVGPSVEVLATHDGDPVLVRQGIVMAAAFHPELAADPRVHATFVDRIIRASPTAPNGGTEMSGHSKWATIKHKKGAADKARGKLFAKLARQLEVAARDGGGDPDINATLRTAVQKAKAAQMTNDAIDRAIKRGTGERRRGHLRVDHVRGLRARRGRPADRRADRQPQPHRRRDPRRVHQARRIAGRARVRSAGSSPGVAWCIVDGTAGEDEVMLAALDAGADDVTDDGGTWRVMSEPSARTSGARRARRRPASDGGVGGHPDGVGQRGADHRRPTRPGRCCAIMEAIEDNDDVQDVFSNFDIADEVMEAAAT